MVDFNLDFGALAMGAIGTVVGAITTTFRGGKAWQRVEDRIILHAQKMDHLDEKITYVCDELARRITVLENRVQFDGLYINRIDRTDPGHKPNRP